MGRAADAAVAQAGGPLLSELRVRNYRSMRDATTPFGQLTVVTGPNGAGKSTLYRALELLQAAAAGTLASTIAQEGGMPSAMWAGAPWRTDTERRQGARARRSGPTRIEFDLTLASFSYALALGLPQPSDPALDLDPIVKLERLRATHGRRPTTLAERAGPTLSARDDEGRMTEVTRDLWVFETALSAVAEPNRHPELDLVRRSLSAMRFYHHFRTDPDSPLRRATPAIMTPSVASDGADWAAALASLARVEHQGFPQSDAARAVSTAFPGGEIDVRYAAGSVSAALRTSEFQRAFAAAELSDGTLRFLVLTAALTALRPPPFLALNEPESSLHPGLIDALADLIGRAAHRSQILVVTHSDALADQLSVEHGAIRLRLRKDRGETIVESE